VVVFAGGIKALGGLRSPSGERSVWAGVGWTCGPVLGCDGQPQSAMGSAESGPGVLLPTGDRRSDGSHHATDQHGQALSASCMT